MPWCVGEMFQDSSSAEEMRGLPRVGADFQHLAEGAKRFSGHLGGVIGARIGDDNDP